jgi:hypothetical protein
MPVGRVTVPDVVFIVEVHVFAAWTIGKDGAIPVLINGGGTKSITALLER